MRDGYFRVNIKITDKLEWDMNKELKTCIDCGGTIARKTKLRCHDCWAGYLKTRVNEKNHQWKGERSSSVAIAQPIIKRLGRAKICNNINCSYASRNYVWVRLKSRSGRRGGIWIQLCLSCKVHLSNKIDKNKGDKQWG